MSQSNYEDVKFDFDSNIKYLLDSNLENTINTNIAFQDKILKSKDFNDTFKYIEDSLNFLYEKSRVLENVIEYSNIYLRNEINNNISECKSLLTSIEDNRDIIKNNNSIKYNVPFVLGSNNYADRDNSAISNTVLYDNKLTLANTSINKYIPNSISIVQLSKNNNIECTLDELIKNNTYRTFYMFTRHQGSEIKEKISIKLDKPSKINKLNFVLSNCRASVITLILEDGSSYIIDNHVGLIKPLVVKSIDIELSCTNYIVSQIDYSKVEGVDFWSKVDNVKADENLDVNKAKFYYYLFGIDDLSIEYVETETQSCFYSKEIKIDGIQENEHITIDVIDSIERGSIEYYIVDGTETISILPEKQTEIIDEKIFYKLSTRFAYDIKKPIIIKRNGDIVKITLQEAINKNEQDAVYTVSYTPIMNQINSLNNNDIKIKAIIRNYDKDFNSFIKSISIKKYGGGKLWIDKI